MVEDFKYLGVWIDNSAKDFKIRKALAWRTCHQIRIILKSTFSRKLKIRLIHITVESVMLFGYDTCTLIDILLKQRDGIYTRILRIILNIYWSHKVTNEVLYGDIVSAKIRRRLLKFAGHFLHRDGDFVSDLVIWEPTYGARRLGIPPEIYIRNLERNTGIQASDMRLAMMNRDVWRTFTVRESTIWK